MIAITRHNHPGGIETAQPILHCKYGYPGAQMEAFFVTIQGKMDLPEQKVIPIQLGDVATEGINGVTPEALLAMAHHLVQEQADDDPSNEQLKSALSSIRESLDWLHERTWKKSVQAPTNAEG